METSSIALIAGIVVLAGTYNVYVSVIKKKNDIREAAADIDVQLKKRYDFIPNILKTAAKFMEHEKEVFTEVTRLREMALKAETYKEKFAADQQLTGAMHSFNVKAENYPALKSDETMMRAQKAMSEIEEHIAASRRFYNSAVKEYKNALEIFPSSMIAAFIGLKDEYPFFEANDIEKQEIDANAYFK